MTHLQEFKIPVYEFWHSKEWNEGYKARQNDHPWYEPGPYEKDSPQDNEWSLGWSAADDDYGEMMRGL